MKENYYTILGVNRDASEDDVRKAYRKLALIYHPDRNKTGDKVAEERFREIVEAYNVLADKNRRILYDYDLNKGIPKVQQQTRPARHAKPAATQTPPRPEAITHHTICKQAHKIRTEVDIIENKSRIKQAELYKALNTLLSLKHIEIVQTAADRKITRRIIEDVIGASRYVAVPYVERLSSKLVKLAAADNELILEIHRNFNKRKNREKFRQYLPLIIIFSIILLLLLILQLA
ncbi:MAG: J domain-containing protein [Chitinophagaceae bacterium]|nr:MAG: J domain-containing protein [Chitinophagaceae bacterium]